MFLPPTQVLIHYDCVWTWNLHFCFVLHVFNSLDHWFVIKGCNSGARWEGCTGQGVWVGVWELQACYPPSPCTCSLTQKLWSLHFFKKTLLVLLKCQDHEPNWTLRARLPWISSLAGGHVTGIEYLQPWGTHYFYIWPELKQSFSTTKVSTYRS